MHINLSCLFYSDDNLPAWKLVHQNIRRFSLYDPDDPNVNTVLDEMSKLPIISMGDAFISVFYIELFRIGLYFFKR